MKRYCIWNNKGGVGKTFLTYILATEYAKEHPEQEVIVVDMCPQANVSEIILGGNGTGQNNLDIIYQNERTIASYIKKRFHSKNTKLGTETAYFIQATDYNVKMPDNLYLLPGDVDLDICSGIINYMAQAPTKGAWVQSRHLLTDLIESFSDRNKTEKVYFIDCNPSFSPYTELAIVASSHLIVPCTADNASIRGLVNIFKLLYSADTADELFTKFYETAKAAGLVLPKVHRVILNRSRSHQDNAAKAFTASIHEVDKRLAELRQSHADSFSEDCDSVCNIKDGNTLATVINHTGSMLSAVSPGFYPIYGVKAQVNKTQIDALSKDVTNIIKKL